MVKLTIPLETLKVASPCSFSWGDMDGDERRRLCHQCGLHVYDLSALSRADAENLIAETEGRRCIRFYRRTDGTVITRDCPVGWRAMKRRLAWISACAATVLFAILSMFGWSMVLTNDKPGQNFVNVNPFKRIFDRLFGPPMRQECIMGMMPIPGPALPAPEAPPVPPVEQ